MAEPGDLQRIVLHSTHRTAGTGGDALFSIAQQALPRHARIAVESIQVPLTYHQIPAGSALFSTNGLNFLEGGVPFSILITPGSYTSSALAVEVQAQLVANSPGALAYTCTYNSTADQFRIATNAAPTIVIAAGSSLPAFRSLGFYREAAGALVLENGNGGFPATVLLSPAAPLSGPSHLMLSSSLPVRSFHTGGRHGALLAVVPVNAGAFEYLSYEPPEKVWHRVNDAAAALALLRVRWQRSDFPEDGEASTVDFRSAAWTLTLLVRGEPI